MKAVTLLCVLVGVVILPGSFAGAGFQWLNNALNGVVFFRNSDVTGLSEIGPCQETFKCSFDFANAPSYIRAIQVSVPLLGTRRVDEFVERGVVDVWNLQCENIEIRDIAIQTTYIDSGKLNRLGDSVDEQNLFIDARNTQLKCVLDADIIDVGLILFEIFGNPVVIPITLRDSKPEVGNGLGAIFNIRFTPTNGRPTIFNFGTIYDGGVTLGAAQTWDRNFPRAVEFFQYPGTGGDISFGRGTTSACDIDIPFGSVKLIRNGGLGADIINGIIVLLIAVFEGVICGFIAGTAQLQIDDVSYTDYSKLGGLNLFINDINGEVKGYKDGGIRDPNDFAFFAEQEIQVIRDNREFVEPEKAINFKTDEIFKGVSKFINDVLGDTSATIAPPFDLVINEVVNSLTDDTGVAGFPDLADSFTFVAEDGYPSIQLNTSMLSVALEFKGFEFSGLNTFTRFKVLENPQNKYEWSVRNSLAMSSLGYSFTIGMRLLAGEYVTANPQGGINGLGLPSPQQTLTISGNLQNLAVNATTFMMVQPQRLLPLQIGQLFGETATVSGSLLAILFALDHFNVMSADPFVGSFGTLSLTDVSSGFGAEMISLITDGFDTFTGLFEGGLAENIGELIENGARPALNDFLETAFIEEAVIPEPYTGTGAENCFEPVDDIGNAPCFFDWTTVAFGSFEGLSTIIEEVIGGNPVQTSGTDINTLINVFLEYFLVENVENISAVPLLFLGPGEIKFRDDIDVVLNTAEFQDEFRFFMGGPRISEIDVVSSLTLNEGPLYEFDFNVGYGTGVILDEFDVPQETGNLTFNIPVLFYSSADGDVLADEAFNISLEVGLEINGFLLAQMNRGRFFRSTIEMLTYTRCFFASLRQRQLSDFTIDIRTFLFTLPQETLSTTAIGTNITALNAEIDANPMFVEYVLQYFLDRIVNATVDIFNEPFNTTTGYAYELENCTTLPSPLEGTPLSEPLPIPTFGGVNDFLGNSTIPQANPRELMRPPSEYEALIVPEGEIAFDITTERNAFVGAFSETLTVESVKTIMISLANQSIEDSNLTGILDPLVELLVLEDDDSVSLVYDIGVEQDLNYLPEVDGIIRGLRFRWYPLVINNIDKLTEVTLFKPYEVDGEVAQFTTESTLTYDESEVITVSFGAEIEIHGEALDRADEGIIRETINVTLEISSFDLELLTTLAVDANKLNETKIEQLVEYDNQTDTFSVREEAIVCEIPKLVFPGGFTFQQLQFVFTGDEEIGISAPKVRIDGEIFSEAWTGLIVSMLDIIFTTLSKQLGNVSQGPVRTFVNEVIAEYLTNVSATQCEPPKARSGEQLLFPFNTAPLSQDIRNFVTNDFFNDNSPFQIDKVFRGIDSFLENNEDVVTTVFPKQELPEYNGLELGGITGLLGSIRLPGVGSEAVVTNLEILDNSLFNASSETPYRTRTRIKFSGPARSSLRIAFSFEPDKIFPAKDNRRLLGEGEARWLEDVELNDYSGGLTNDLELELTMQDFELSIDLDMLVDVNALLNLRVGNVLNVYSEPQSTPCFLSIFEEDGLVPQGFNLTFAENGVSVGLSCRGTCNSVALQGLDIGTSFDTNNQVSEDLSNGLATAIDLIKLFVASSDAQDYLNLAIATAKTNCVAFDTTFLFPSTDKGVDAAYYMLLIYLGFLLIVTGVVIFLVPQHLNRKARILERLKTHRAPPMVVALTKQKISSLFHHPAIGKKTSYIIPLCIVTSTIFFIIGNFFTVGATVLLTLNILGDETLPLPLFVFTLQISINDAWNAGAIPMALAIVIASGYWPYTKILLLHTCWFCPGTLLLPKTRGKLLDVLDSLGKWSLIDAYVLIILQVAFRVYITTTTIDQLNFLPPDIVVVDVAVNPGFGIYGFLIGTMSSLIVNHVMIAYHERAVDYDEKLDDKITGHVSKFPARSKARKTSIKEYAFRKGRDTGSQYLYFGFGPGARVVVGALMVLSFLFIGVGLFLPLVSFNFSGLIGIFLQIVDPNAAQVTNSAMSIVTALADGAAEDVGTQMGILFLQIVYVAFVAITPLGLVIMFAILWFKKFTLNVQKQLFFVTKIVFAWEALAILIVSVFGALFQITQLVAFVLLSATGAACTFIPEQLSLLGVNAEDSKCFTVGASLEPSSIVIILGMVLLITLHLVMFRLIGEAIHDREIFEKQKYWLLHDPTKQKGFKGLILRALVRPVKKGQVPEYHNKSQEMKKALLPPPTPNRPEVKAVRKSKMKQKSIAKHHKQKSVAQKQRPVTKKQKAADQFPVLPVTIGNSRSPNPMFRDDSLDSIDV